MHIALILPSLIATGVYYNEYGADNCPTGSLGTITLWSTISGIIALDENDVLRIRFSYSTWEGIRTDMKHYGYNKRIPFFLGGSIPFQIAAIQSNGRFRRVFASLIGNDFMFNKSVCKKWTFDTTAGNWWNWQLEFEVWNFGIKFIYINSAVEGNSRLFQSSVFPVENAPNNTGCVTDGMRTFPQSGSIGAYGGHKHTNYTLKIAWATLNRMSIDDIRRWIIPNGLVMNTRVYCPMVGIGIGPLVIGGAKCDFGAVESKLKSGIQDTEDRLKKRIKENKKLFEQNRQVVEKQLRMEKSIQENLAIEIARNQKKSFQLTDHFSRFIDETVHFREETVHYENELLTSQVAGAKHMQSLIQVETFHRTIRDWDLLMRINGPEECHANWIVNETTQRFVTSKLHARQSIQNVALHALQEAFKEYLLSQGKVNRAIRNITGQSLVVSNGSLHLQSGYARREFTIDGSMVTGFSDNEKAIADVIGSVKAQKASYIAEMIVGAFVFLTALIGCYKQGHLLLLFFIQSMIIGIYMVCDGIGLLVSNFMWGIFS